MAEYEFSSEWRIEAPRAAVWAVVRDPTGWPLWWNGLERVELLRAGAPSGAGAAWRFVWRGALPYRLVVDIAVVKSEPPAYLEATVSGGLRGVGRWRLRDDGSATLVDFEWHVGGPRRWMRFVAPLARPLFRRNYDGLMRAGRDGLARHLAER